MSLVTRKSVFWVFNQVRHKPACAATEASWRLEIWDIETKDIILSRQWTTKVLIRLRGCAGWTAPLLVAYDISRFSHNKAYIKPASREVRRPRSLLDWSKFYEKYSHDMAQMSNWASLCENGTYPICKQRTLRQACRSTKSCESLHC